MLNSSIYLGQKTRPSRAGHGFNATPEHKKVKAAPGIKPEPRRMAASRKVLIQAAGDDPVAATDMTADQELQRGMRLGAGGGAVFRALPLGVMVAASGGIGALGS